jgi:AraC-like DNA-binding protein
VKAARPARRAATPSAPAVSVRRYGSGEAGEEHDFHQIVLGLDGAMALSIGSHVQRIDRAHGSVIPAGMRHEYCGIGENRQLVVDLPRSSLAIPERLFERAVCVDLDTAFGQTIATLARAAQSTDPREHWLAAAHLGTALMQRRELIYPRTHPRTNPVATLDFRAVDAWLRAHLGEPVRVAELAARYGWGLRRFHQVFQDAFGMAPHQYLQQLRLDVAVRQLAEPRLSLADVALSTGFADQSAFTRAFTQRFGMPPGQWRRGSSRRH